MGVSCPELPISRVDRQAQSRACLIGCSQCFDGTHVLARGRACLIESNQCFDCTHVLIHGRACLMGCSQCFF